VIGIKADIAWYSFFKNFI